MRQDPVRNRRLFKRRQEVAARNKLRELGNIGGILSSSQELIDAAQEGFSPAIEQKMTGQGKVITGQQPMGQVPMNQPMGLTAIPEAEKQQIEISVKQQENNGDPLKLQAGGILSMDPNYADYMAGQKFRNPTVPVAAPSGGTIDPNLAFFIDGQAKRADIMNPAGTVYDDAILRQSRLKKNGFDPATVGKERGLAEIKDALGGNIKAKEKLSTVEAALTSDSATDEEQLLAVTDAFGVENSKEGLQQISKYLDPGAKTSNKVDELLDSITGVAVGGAIGGDRSMAKRISDAMLVGLNEKLDVEKERESSINELIKASLTAEEASNYTDKAVKRTSELLGIDYYELLPNERGINSGLQGKVIRDNTIDSAYAAKSSSVQKNLQQVDSAIGLLDAEDGGVAGFAGVAGRLKDSLKGIPGAETFLGKDLSNATKYDQVLRVLAAQLAPELLGESGRTISDGDRARVAEMLGFAVSTNKDGTFTIGKFVGRGFSSDEELKNQIMMVRDLIESKAKKIDDEYIAIVTKIPGASIPERPETQKTNETPNVIELTAEDLETYGNPKQS